VRQCIRVRGISSETRDGVWESSTRLRIGRLETLEIVIDDSSVSRSHAEVFSTPRGWRIRDLKSTNGTFLNGKRLGAADWEVRPHDVLKCGNVTFVVDAVTNPADTNTEQVDGTGLVVEATARPSWEQAIRGLTFERSRSLRPGEQLVALLRAGHHLCHIDDEEILLHSILNDAVGALDAQRGAIVLADGPTQGLRLRALATSDGQVGSRAAFSQSLAQKAFGRGESILYGCTYEDPELAMAQSIADGAMASVLCVLLRTPRKRLGVLHLDRGLMQKPFTKQELHLADALAASVSAGIESAQLLKQQREFFLNTITILAQAIDLRDDYTGGHTARVTKYSEMLARQLKLATQELKWIRFGTPLHDIGKIGIDDAILRKPGPLTPEEFRVMQTHTVKGAAILGTLPDLAPIMPIVRNHHERWDGRGYPDNLAGQSIPLYARIVAVADTFDAMTSDRPYRKAMEPSVAFAEIEKQSAKQFDPDCAKAFLAIQDRVVDSMQVDMTTIMDRSDARELVECF
jgi:HD-GYP domain-containing protein (c-di-GMP phosphodiesterase class II)